MSVQKYSKTPASNVVVNDGSDAVSTAEGMARASVNDAIRALMADVAKYVMDHGTLTTGGSGSAYTLSTNSQIAALTDGLSLTAKAHEASASGATLNVNGLGARPLKLRGADGLVTAPAGAIVAGDMLAMTYRDGAWVCTGLADYGSVVRQVFSAATILSELLEVDGSGSGLDADKLDGQEGSHYLNASNLNAGTVPLARLPSGAGKNLDADKLDGEHGSFYRSASNLVSGTVPLARLPSGSGAGLDADKLDGQHGAFYRDASNLNAGKAPLERLPTGSGAGFDADKLDGQHGTFYRSASNLNAGTVPAARLSGTYSITASYAQNSDKLDGLQGSQFARTDIPEAFDTEVDFNGLIDARGGGSNQKIRLGYQSSSTAAPYISGYRGTSRLGYLQFDAGRVRLTRDGGAYFDLAGAGEASVSGYAIDNAGRAAGAVGSYALLERDGGNAAPLVAGATQPGSVLRYSSANGDTGARPAGTWRCVGHLPVTTASAGGALLTTLWKRIA